MALIFRTRMATCCCSSSGDRPLYRTRIVPPFLIPHRAPHGFYPPNILVLTRGDDAGNTLLLLVAAPPDIDVSFFQLLLQHQALVIAKKQRGTDAAAPGGAPRAPCARLAMCCVHS